MKAKYREQHKSREHKKGIYIFKKRTEQTLYAEQKQSAIK